MKKVLFYPDPPVQLPGHSLSKTITYFNIIGYELTNDIKTDWDIGVHWDIRDINETPKELLDDKRMVLNRNLNNVSKSYVDKIFTKVFGYSSLADTTKFGYCVRKGEAQSAHDGEIIKMPCQKEVGYNYQLFINNRSSADMIYDIRIQVFLGKFPLLFIKHKSIGGIFNEHLENVKKRYSVDDVYDYLTPDEVEKVGMFCEKTGFDIGEIDALRDNSTGLLYLVDVNNIPGWGVFEHIKDGEKVRDGLAWFLNSQIDG